MKFMELLKKFWSFLAGRKTYIVAFLFIVLAGLKEQGYIDLDTYELIIGVLGAMGLAAVRHGISRLK